MGEFFGMFAMVLLLAAVGALIVVVSGLILEYFAKCIARGWQIGVSGKGYWRRGE